MLLAIHVLIFVLEPSPSAQSPIPDLARGHVRNRHRIDTAVGVIDQERQPQTQSMSESESIAVVAPLASMKTVADLTSNRIRTTTRMIELKTALERRIAIGLPSLTATPAGVSIDIDQGQDLQLEPTVLRLPTKTEMTRTSNVRNTGTDLGTANAKSATRTAETAIRNARNENDPSPVSSIITPVVVVRKTRNVTEIGSEIANLPPVQGLRNLRLPMNQSWSSKSKDDREVVHSHHHQPVQHQ